MANSHLLILLRNNNCFRLFFLRLKRFHESISISLPYCKIILIFINNDNAHFDFRTTFTKLINYWFPYKNLWMETASKLPLHNISEELSLPLVSVCGVFPIQLRAKTAIFILFFSGISKRILNIFNNFFNI